MRMKRGHIVIVLALFGMICSGCISNDSTPTTTVPDNVDTTPILASELLAEWEELLEAYESEKESTQEMLDELLAMAQIPNPNYAKLYQASEEYHDTMLEYRYTLRDYYRASILLEHTTPTVDDLLELKKETIPFDRPDGDMYTMGELNMEGEAYNFRFDRIRDLLLEGIDGNDVQEDIIKELTDLEEFLPGYYDMEIGYAYYIVNQNLNRQAKYSDVLIKDCNPLCI